jgi:dynein heavy chain
MKVDLAVLFQAPVIYTNFADTQGGEYLPLSSGEQLRTVLKAKLVEYNEANAMMDLVLFDMACYHVSRIARILANPGGNAMLIGVGGSGKQSLCKLASFISGYEVQQIQVTGSYGIEDLKEDLRSYYNLAIGKNTPVVFLMTDGQIIDDHFLVYLNAMLSSGWISDLFPKEDIDNLIGSLRNDAKAAAVPDNPEAMFVPCEALPIDVQMRARILARRRYLQEARAALPCAHQLRHYRRVPSLASRCTRERGHAVPCGGRI